MKKYVKPDLVYENFELSLSIANCSAALNHAENSCTLDSNEAPGLFLESGETVFTAGNCTHTTEIIEDYCYWTGDSSNNIFTS